MPVQPDLDRVREVRADLDERRPERLVDDVEVVGDHPPVGLGEAEVRRAGAVAVLGAGGEHPLELLRHPDRGHPAPALRGQPVQVRAHHLQFPLALGEPDHRHVVLRGEPSHRQPEPVPDLLQQRRRRDREPEVAGEEAHHLPAHLQRRHVPVEVDPVEALQVQHHVPAQNVVHRHRPRRHRRHLQRQPAARQPPQRPPGGLAAQPQPLRAASDRSQPRRQATIRLGDPRLGGPRLASLA